MSEFESSDNFDDVDLVADTGPADAERLAEKEFESGMAQSLGEQSQEVVVTTDKPGALIAGMTEDELKEAISKAKRFDELDGRLTKTHDTAFGRIGQMEQALKELQSRPAGQRQQFSKELFTSITEYIGDDGLSEAFANDLSNALFVTGSQSSDDYKEGIRALKEEMETKLLTMVHRDWRAIAKSEEFAIWQNSISPEARQVLNETWDGEKMIEAFDSFKDWRSRKADAEQKKQQRLEEAMPAKSTGGAARSATSNPFNEGMKSVLTK
ncbi:conserved hypothetical protein [Gammaproteobacteria bacterium]